LILLINCLILQFTFKGDLVFKVYNICIAHNKVERLYGRP